MTTPELEALVGLSAALARKNEKALRGSIQECLDRVRPEEVEEVILQSYLFLGYPIALNAFGLWRKISGIGPSEPVPDDWEMWSDRGSSVCSTVYGGQYDGLRRNVRALHPDMERWMVVEGYGKVLGRPGLPLGVRELCIVGLLAVLGAPKQLYSHLRGALNAGATVDEVRIALSVAGQHVGEDGVTEAMRVWTEVRSRWMDNRENRSSSGSSRDTGSEPSPRGEEG